MTFTRIAVLLTCFNRQEKTLTCLKSLFQQVIIQNTKVDVFLVDDGSTDNTLQIVINNFPSVKIINGNGNLFWCGGMNLAWNEASKGHYDYYLWLNDDVILYSTALKDLLTTAFQKNIQEDQIGIIIGSTCDPIGLNVTYGGSNNLGGLPKIIPSDEIQTCLTFNGNIVLVPNEVFKKIGNLSQEFKHIFGDMDYALRATKQGFKLWIAPGYQGHCANNSIPNWRNPKIPLKERWQHLHSPKGQPPREVYIFAKKNRKSGLLAVIKNYIDVLSPQNYIKIKKLLGKI